MTAPTPNAEAWGLPRVIDFFTTARATTAEVYPSEWFFLKDRLREGISVLDVGCAQGGFSAVLAEHLEDFRYTGVDVSPAMVAAARARFPRRDFQVVGEGDLSTLGEARFDLVLALGHLHLHERWRDTLAEAWRRTAGALIFDLRHVDGPTVEDKTRAYMAMDFHGGGSSHAAMRLPYILLNAGEALAAVRAACPGAARIAHYGYLHRPTGTAVLPVEAVMAVTWCVER
jgi:SAM-dependent methyltransferase